MNDSDEVRQHAEVLFIVADLFGDGGKLHNASFAALITRLIADQLVNEKESAEQIVQHLRDVAAILECPTFIAYCSNHGN